MDLNPKDLGDHFMIPREDFYDLATSAFGVDPTLRDRIVTSVQSTVLCAALAGCVIVGSRGYFRAKDWYEDRKYNRITTGDPDPNGVIKM